MFKSAIISLGLLASAVSYGSVNLFDVLSEQVNSSVISQAQTTGLEWKLGEKNDYTIDMTITKGTMTMEVTEISADGIWVDQKADLGFVGKQDSRTLFDKNTGEVKKMIVGGKEQPIPKNNMEMIETKEDKITVPAGTFQCIYARMKDKDNNQEISAWVNPQAIPISGMLKMTRPFQLGTITMELQKFLKK